ncbi:MAG: hypothetical protein EPO64_11845 [Nitrospirae bacterium]|nr:MAG: hypothetical protein EPO64_11845 [Nitrospirota bacterium]
MPTPKSGGIITPPNLMAVDSEIQGRILALLREHRRLMFSAIATALPDCTWHTLFSALNHLQKRQQVELVAHRWDYEVVLLNGHALN